jgi:hypothetical protein
MPEIYGQLDSEKIAKENGIAREIVKEINTFGINDRQRWMIIKLLSLELENVTEMKELSTFIDEMKGKDLFVSRIFSTDETPDPNQEIS